MRGYGRSSVYREQAAYAQREVVTDMLELLDELGRERAVWVGHDWGSPTVWNLARLHPARCVAVANLCVPYFTIENGLESVLPLIDRTLYPATEYPAGQWEYMRYYEENFARATAVFEADPYLTMKLLLRKGDPAADGTPAMTAHVRRNGGWFGPLDRAPYLPRDDDVVSAEDLDTYAEALTRNGFFGPDSYYMNHAANAAYVAGHPERLDLPVLFLHARYDYVCETMRSRLAEPMRARCTRLSETIIDAGHWMAGTSAGGERASPTGSPRRSMPPRGPCRRRTARALLARGGSPCCFASTPPPLSPHRAPLGGERLARVVAHLRTAHPVERLQFAAIALDTLAQSYREEIDASARRGGDAGAIARWQAAVRTEIAQLEAMAAALPTVSDVLVLLEPGDVPRLVVGNESVLLDAPRVDASERLSAALVARYCTRADCSRLAPPSADPPRVWASWSFGGQGSPVLETSAGLDFRFADSSRLQQRQAAALALARTFASAAHELAWYTARGAPIDWEVLHCAPLATTGAEVLVIDRAGTYLALSGPCAGLPAAQVAAWFATRLRGGSTRVLVDDAARYLDAYPLP